MEPLGKFQEDWRPDEPRRLDPVYVERTSLRDALAARRGLSPQNILGYVELIEPTFQVRGQRESQNAWLCHKIYHSAAAHSMDRLQE